jgi:hypothetical protein
MTLKNKRARHHPSARLLQQHNNGHPLQNKSDAYCTWQTGILLMNYFENPALNFSSLKILLKSPAALSMVTKRATQRNRLRIVIW